MPLTMRGPVRLIPAEIDRVLFRVGAGVFGVGPYAPAGPRIIVRLVGRSDKDLAASLRELVGTYEGFTYSYAETTAEAFRMECELYHEFTPPDNASHPNRPRGTGWRCPVCRRAG